MSAAPPRAAPGSAPNRPSAENSMPNPMCSSSVVGPGTWQVTAGRGVDQEPVRVPPAVLPAAFDVDPASGGIARHGVHAHGVRSGRADPLPVARGHGQGQTDHGPEAERQRAMRAAQVGPADGDLGHAADEQAESQGQKGQHERPLLPAEDSVAATAERRSATRPRSPPASGRGRAPATASGSGRAVAPKFARPTMTTMSMKPKADPRSVEQQPEPGVAVVAAERRKRVRGHPGNRSTGTRWPPPGRWRRATCRPRSCPRAAAGRTGNPGGRRPRRGPASTSRSRPPPPRRGAPPPSAPPSA